MTTFIRKIILILVLAGLAVSGQATAGSGSIVSLETQAGRSFQVYAAGPKDADRGILLVHGWYGLNDQARLWADKFAAAGYLAMSIDLYDGKLATDSKTARTYMNAVKQSEANEKYRAVLKALLYLRIDQYF
jgi:carboxymethylenebutenolidase